MEVLCMEKLEVGQVIPRFVGHPESPLFDVNDGGANLIILFKNPTADEKKAFKPGERFEIRMVLKDGIIMMMVKIGNLNWMDAPYTPHLSKNLSKLDKTEEGQGLALSLMLVDCATGKLESIRLIGLSTRFTNALYDNILTVFDQNFDPLEYNTKLDNIYRNYSTKDLLKFARDYYKTN